MKREFIWGPPLSSPRPPCLPPCFSLPRANRYYRWRMLLAGRGSHTKSARMPGTPPQSVHSYPRPLWCCVIIWPRSLWSVFDEHSVWVKNAVGHAVPLQKVTPLMHMFCGFLCASELNCIFFVFVAQDRNQIIFWAISQQEIRSLEVFKSWVWYV